MRERCDYRHADGADRLAAWFLIGESGDYFVCDEHFAQRTEEGRRGWRRIPQDPDPDDLDATGYPGGAAT